MTDYLSPEILNILLTLSLVVAGIWIVALHLEKDDLQHTNEYIKAQNDILTQERNAARDLRR